MPSSLTRLHPPPAARHPLEGLCLRHRLLAQADRNRPYIYSSFITSLNGVIAVADGRSGWTHPETLTDPRDFRLLCELMAQADCLITSAGYLRDLERGRLGNLLQLPQAPQYRDLLDYRARHHDAPHPSVLALSRSLDFRLPPSLAKHRQTLRVLTPEGAPQQRLDELRGQGVDVVVDGAGEWVESEAVIAALKDLGARTAYLFCGPRLNGILMRAGRVRRLYLTWLHRLQGGHPALTAGSFLPGTEAPAMRLGELYQAEAEGELPGLWFGYFDAGV